MLAFVCGYGDGAKRDQVISITDRLLPWEVHGSDTAKTYFPGGPENYRAYRKAWELHTLHFGEDVRAAENMEFISQGSSNRVPSLKKTLQVRLRCTFRPEAHFRRTSVHLVRGSAMSIISGIV